MPLQTDVRYDLDGYTGADGVFGAFTALGTIAFAYGALCRAFARACPMPRHVVTSWREEAAAPSLCLAPRPEHAVANGRKLKMDCVSRPHFGKLYFLAWTISAASRRHAGRLAYFSWLHAAHITGIQLVT